MKKILSIFFFSLLLFSCEKTLPDVPDDEIPAWLKTRNIWLLGVHGYVINGKRNTISNITIS
jgi:hypothetical protein